MVFKNTPGNDCAGNARGLSFNPEHLQQQQQQPQIDQGAGGPPDRVPHSQLARDGYVSWEVRPPVPQ